MKKSKKPHSGRSKIDPSLTRVRSAITNGSHLLADVDGRSSWMRRLRDLIQGHIADAGGGVLLTSVRPRPWPMFCREEATTYIRGRRRAGRQIPQISY